MAKNRTYDEKFKANAVALVIDSHRSVAEVAEELGIGSTALYRWVDQSKARGRKPSEETPEQRVARLEDEVRTLRLEREILKKAVAFFAKESK